MTLLDYVWAFDREECGTARLVYICNIIKQFNQGNWLLPTASQEKTYDEALGHLVRVLSGNNNSNNTPSSLGGIVFRSCEEGCSNEKNRKNSLKEILNLLICMQRNRLYDPPSDQEIGYYQLIKKYIRSIVTFYEARYGSDRDAELGCFSPFRYLHHMTELVELSKYAEELLPIVSKMDIKNGSKAKPLMDIEHKNQMPTIIYASKERSNAFYSHKFQLALSELRSSKFQLSPPHAEEKRSYHQAMDLMSPSFSSCELDVYTEELRHIFIERIESEVNNVDGQCRKIKRIILEKLSLEKQWDTLLQQYKDDASEELDDVSRQMAENCEISTEELPSYIAYLDQCLQILDNLSLFTSGLSTDNYNLLTWVYFDNRPEERIKLGWEAFNALAFLKQGACHVDPTEVRHDSTHLNVNYRGRSLRARIRNRPKRIGMSQIRLKVGSISRISYKCPSWSISVQSWSALMVTGQIRSTNCQHHDSERTKRYIAVENEKNENVNVKVLKFIIEGLKIIGDSDVRPDEEELILMHKIWNNVASATHFSFCARLYEQRRYVIERGGLSNVGMSAAKTSKKLDDVDVQQSVLKIEDLRRELSISTQIIDAYKQGLVDKLGNYKKSSKYS